MTLTVTTDLVQTDVRQAIAAMLRNVVQLSLSAATLAVTATGFARTDGGSFLDDRFVDGAELTSAGFANAANNGRTYLRAVTDATLTVAQADGATPLVVEAAGANATLSIAYPATRDNQRVFGATPGIPWARLTLLRAANASQRMGVAINPMRVHTGWASVDLFYPRDRGENAANSMADAVRQAAEAHEELVYQGRAIYLLHFGTNAGPSILTSSFEDVWYKLPVRIPFYTFV